MKLEKALEELRNQKKRNFDETIDLIVNLKKFDIKRNNINTFISLPHKIKDKKICGFLEIKNSLIDTIPKSAFVKYKDRKSIKNLVKKYDFFISSGANMPSVATTFGRVLGPAGKMPSPKLGILMNESESDIRKIIEKINLVVRIQTKEPSIKIPIGKNSMSDGDLLDNFYSAFNSILNELPNKKENIKSVLIKSTMSKPIKVEI
ncbi:MAG: hypothetical protein QXI33_00220 [Candidatus Pacearchaeota archaeon]